MKDLTPPQLRLLKRLWDDYQVTLQDGYYTVVTGGGDEVERIWPHTFHSLFNMDMIKRNESGNYVISDRGREVLKEG